MQTISKKIILIKKTNLIADLDYNQKILWFVINGFKNSATISR